jgi:hypothetical protein
MAKSMVNPATEVRQAERLHALEKEICEGLEEFYHTGRRLKEIRDNKLYEADGYPTWEDYCRDRWQWSRDYTYKLIRASEYRALLPGVDKKSTSRGSDWTESSVRELTRIEDKKEAARVAKKIIDKVEKTEGAKLTSGFVRAVVDEELGIDRAAKAREAKSKAKDNGIDLRQYLGQTEGHLKGTREALEEHIDQDAWAHFTKQDSTTVNRLRTACVSLVALLDKVQPPQEPAEGWGYLLQMEKDKRAELQKKLDRLQQRYRNLEEEFDRYRKEQAMNCTIDPGQVFVREWYKSLALRYDRNVTGSTEPMRILDEARDLLVELSKMQRD